MTLMPAPDHQQTTGGIGGAVPSDFSSKISDMCGDFRWNFGKIPSLPEQTTAKSKILQCREGKPRTNAGIRSKALTLSTRQGGHKI